MTKDFLYCVTACLLILLSPAAAQGRGDQQDSAAEEIKAGTSLLQQGNYPEAKVHFERAKTLQGKPTAETSAGIGLAELQMGHLEAARQMFKLELQFVTNDHARAQAHYMIGSAWLRETANDASNSNLSRSLRSLILQRYVASNFIPEFLKSYLFSVSKIRFLQVISYKR